MKPARLGAVSYLNTKPLVHGLEARPDLFTVRFDVPAVCASLLHEGGVDLGLIPAIEYLRGDYAIVPDLAIGSDGPVLSVAIFSTVPIEQVRTLALDLSSRTSVALTRILCARLWDIAAGVHAGRARPPDDAGQGRCGAGDRRSGAGDRRRRRSGVMKIDLGEAWQSLTGLPFVYATWTGRDGARRSRAGGRAAGRRAGRACRTLPLIAREVAGGDAAARGPGPRATCVIISSTGWATARSPVSSASTRSPSSSALPSAPPSAAVLLMSHSSRRPAGSASKAAAASRPTRRCSCIAHAPTLLARPPGRSHPRAQASRTASSPTSSTATSTTRTSAWRAATSARSTGRSGIAEGYVLGFDEIFRKIDETIARRRRPAAAAGRAQSGSAARSGTRICSAR